jgi:diacylglycerol kinase
MITNAMLLLLLSKLKFFVILATLGKSIYEYIKYPNKMRCIGTLIVGGVIIAIVSNASILERTGELITGTMLNVSEEVLNVSQENKVDMFDMNYKTEGDDLLEIN